MTISEFIFRSRRRFWNKLVEYTREKKVYPYLYRSFWHYILSKPITVGKNTSCYFAARPNLGAGIGHQLANWIAGYWFANQFGLKFAHIPFSNSKWDQFLGFGIDEKKVSELVQSGYKIRRIPLFDENNANEVNLVKAIIHSYSGRQVVFVAEQDQGYKDQFGVIADIKRKFNNAPSRRTDEVRYDPNRFNIAVHVRRTVIIDGKVIVENEAAQSLRWLSNDYYEKVLIGILENLKVTKPVSIYLFSTGKAEDFAEFASYGDVHFCSDMDEYSTFLHLIRADLLITSKSSFSYKPALMNEAIKVCPRNFWHGYPSSNDWIMVENDGTFEIPKLIQIFK